MEFGFLNAWAFYGLAVLVPVIILYLLKPKPKELKIPSLMFIKEVEQRRRFSSFFKRLFRDPLLLLQLLILTILVLALAGPFMLSQETHDIQEAVAIIIDSSASMQARDVQPTRFGAALATARQIVLDLQDNDHVTLVLAENIPVVALNKGTKQQALAIIPSLRVKDTPTGLGNSVILAKDILADSEVKKTIYILSDFSNYEGSDPVAASKSAFAAGMSIVPIVFASEGENVGIVSGRAGRRLDQCFAEAIVKDFGNERSVNIIFSIDGIAVASDTKTLRTGDTELFSFSGDCTTSEHTLNLFIDGSDALPVDDEVWFILSEQKQFRALLIKERESADYIRYALESLPNVQVDSAIPTVIPSLESYDVVVFQSATPEALLPGTFKLVEDFVRSGGDAIIIGSEALAFMDPEFLPKLLPVLPAGSSKVSGSPQLLFDHPILSDIDIESLYFEEYVRAFEKEDAITLATIGDSPLLAYRDLDNGGVLYAGLGPNATLGGFYLQPSFPIFWSQVFDWLGREEAIGSLSYFTGEQLPIFLNQTEHVEKPSGEVVETKNPLLDEVGIYNLPSFGRHVAANLLDDRESDIESISDADALELESSYSSKLEEQDVQRELFWLAALAALFLILLEWSYYKRRGSL